MSGRRTFEDFHNKAQFIRISSAGLRESHVHDVTITREEPELPEPGLSMAAGKRIVLAARPVGEPKESDFRIEDTSVPTPGPGEMLLRTLWLSLDPYMRGRMSDAPSYATPVGIGQVMEGRTVSEVVASNRDGFAAAISCSARTAGRPTPSPMASLCERSTRSWRRSRPRSACSACRA
jgi:hypothetical protein